MENIITYKIQEDLNGKLKSSAKEACNFWNEFITPATPIVIRLGYFSFGRAVAKAWEPWAKDGITYARIEFNRRKLRRYSQKEVVTSLIHEIGHALGFGWERWNQLYSKRTGKFHNAVAEKLPALKKMRVELNYRRGTKYSHWDERLFDGEIMTGLKDQAEYVLPITIDVMTMLGHTVKQSLDQKTPLDTLLERFALRPFERQNDLKDIDVDYLEETQVDEEILDELSIPAINESDADENTEATLPRAAPSLIKGSLAIIVGHSRRRSGARATAPLLMSEYDYNTGVAAFIKDYAQELGQEVEVFTRDESSIEGAYQNAENWEPDAICELHFNAANGRAKGTEILYSDARDNMGIYEKDFAHIMQTELCTLFNRQGRENRGIKNRAGHAGERGFVNLRQTFNIPSILLEPFFGDNPDDAVLGLEQKEEYAKTILNAFIKWKKQCADIYANS